MSNSTSSPATLVMRMCATYGPSGPVKPQSNRPPTLALTPDGQCTSFGLNPVCRETTSTTDFAAPSGWTVLPQPVSCSAATPISTPTPHFRPSFRINSDLFSSGPKYAAVLLFTEGKAFVTLEFDGKPKQLNA